MRATVSNAQAGGAAVVCLLVTFALAIAWSTRILDDEVRLVAPRGVAEARLAGAEEIGIVDMTQFDLESRSEALRAEKQRRLDSYGWVDRDAGIIHLPIVRAMDDVVRELWRGGDGG